MQEPVKEAQPVTETRTVENEVGAEPKEPEETPDGAAGSASSGGSSGSTIVRMTPAGDLPKTASAAAEEGGSAASGSGTLSGDGQGTVTTRVNAGDSSNSATARKLLTYRGFLFNSNDHAGLDFFMVRFLAHFLERSSCS